MTPERYQQVGKLFDEALERPQAERAEWLRQNCGTDEELRAAVENLLAHHSEADAFLSRPALEVAAAQAPSLIGQQLGHYRILSLLGAGGMGEVYLAEDATLRRKIALKVLPAYVAKDQEHLRRFKQEALAASALNHPNIVTIHEFGTAGDTHFLVTELVEGETLRDRLRRGALSLNAALDLTQQIATALQAAHEAGIIHRDIKPENVMVRRDGLVKVLDFGLAKLTNTRRDDAQLDDERHSTEAGTVLGTVAYMSPEQARGQRVDARSDLFSLGVVLYEMFTGSRPFNGETPSHIIVAIIEKEPAPLSHSFPAGIEPLVKQLLAKEVAQRYPDARALLAEVKKLQQRLAFESEIVETKPALAISELETLRHSVKHTAPASTSPSPGLAGLLRLAQTHKVRSAMLVLVLFTLVLSAVYFFSNRKIDSIAVLPFENRSGNPELAYVSDGLSESLIDRLSELPQLKVISRNSSFKFRGANSDLRNIASQLGVRAILTGSVAQVGEDLVIRFSLVDASNDQQITGGQYQRKANNILRVQNEIAQAASEKLLLKLTDSQSKRLAESGTENSDAYRYYLSGLVELNGPQDARSKALEYFEQAEALDPNFAAAHAEIAWIYWERANGNDNPHELLPKTKAAIERALAIDPDLAKAHVLRAMVNECEFAWADSEREYLRAIELSPNLAFARNNYAFFLSVMGRQDDALAELEQLSIRDPINRRLTLLYRGFILTQARKFDDALQAYQEAQALEPRKEVQAISLAYAYAGKGLYSEAARYYQKAVELVGGENKYSQALVYLAATYAKIPEKRSQAQVILQRIEARSGYASPAILAVAYAALDNNDKALELLERAYLERDLLLRYIKTGYEYDGLRADPRFVALTKRSGLSK